MTAPDSADMPETIWANASNQWDTVPGYLIQPTQYTRADIADTLAAALEEAARELRMWHKRSPEKITGSHSLNMATEALELYRGRK